MYDLRGPIDPWGMPLERPSIPSPITAKPDTGGPWGTPSGDDYILSPPAAKLLNLLGPQMSQLGTGGPLWDVPLAVGPTADWYGNLSPDVMQGVWAPYQDASKQFMEQLGAGGLATSQRGGISGAGAAGLGKFWEQAGRNVGQQAWGMTAPGLMAKYEADINAMQYPWMARQQLFSQAMPTPKIDQSGGGKK
jgi:hypothetical protein